MLWLFTGATFDLRLNIRPCFDLIYIVCAIVVVVFVVVVVIPGSGSDSGSDSGSGSGSLHPTLPTQRSTPRFAILQESADTGHDHIH